jgi:uncharacterized membrane protein
MNSAETLELKIARFLRIGVLIAGAIMLLGWMSEIKLSGNPFFNFETYDQISLRDLIEYHLYRKDWGVLVSYAGLAFLIILPVVRVLLTAWLFIRQKEFLLAGLAMVVLAGLIVSMSLGIDL